MKSISFHPQLIFVIFHPSGIPEPPVAGSVLLPNISLPEQGPVYSVAGISVLGPPVYNIVEGQELALICTVTTRDRTSSLLWRKKVN